MYGCTIRSGPYVLMTVAAPEVQKTCDKSAPICKHYLGLSGSHGVTLYQDLMLERACRSHACRCAGEARPVGWAGQ